MRPEEADREEEGPVLLLRTAFEHPLGILGHDAVGVMLVALGGRIPTEGAAELAGEERKDPRLFFESIHAGRVKLQFPGAGVVVAVGADGPRHVVVIELADPGREVPGVAERLRQTDLRRDRLSEDLLVRENAGTVRIKAGEERIAAWPAEGKAQ